MLIVKPKSIDDIARCLAIIRPAAKDARVNYNEIDIYTKNCAVCYWYLW